MTPRPPGPLTLFLSGDVMTGRGVDQILPSSVDPELHEPYVKSASAYVRLAEEASGPIPAPVSHDYVWGDALAELERARPHARIVNLETAVTTSDDWPEWKGIHYRMHPDNVPVLTAAGVDACVLGNNHVLDWGPAGLVETLEVLETAGLVTAGAGRDVEEAARPAVIPTDAGRLLVFSYASPTSGVPEEWAAGPEAPGVRLLPTLGAAGAGLVIEDVLAHRRDGDRVVVSIHWGGNWGYEVPDAQRELAREVVGAGAADIVHGHSSHHPKGIEIHRGRLILYGCGDFLNDYEGIGGREPFRGDVALMYLPTLEPGGELAGLVMVPLRIRRFRLERASHDDARWLADLLDRESRAAGAPVELDASGRLRVAPNGRPGPSPAPGRGGASPRGGPGGGADPLCVDEGHVPPRGHRGRPPGSLRQERGVDRERDRDRGGAGDVERPAERGAPPGQDDTVEAGAVPGRRDDARTLARVRRLAVLLDAAVGIPGTRVRFGLDSLLGLIPGGGDVAGALLSGGVVLAAARAGAPPSLLFRMLGNLALDALVGSVPVAGDLFDVAWKANMRNVQLLERHLDDPEAARRGSRTLVIAAGAGVAVVVLLLLAAVIGAARVVAGLLGA